MVALQEHHDRFQDAGATVFGVSADSPFAQGAFRDRHDLAFDLVSDMAGDAIAAYDVALDVPDLGLYGVANRAVFVVDGDGEVAYAWRADDPTTEPDYEELLGTVESLAAA
jgi:peroxiredoxin